MIGSGQPGVVRIASAPHADTFGYSMPPPGLLRLGGWLERAGWRVELDDLAFRLARGDLREDERYAERIAEHLLAGGAPWILGLSVMGATLPIALLALEEVRRRAPRVVTLLGGPGTTGIDAALLERFPSLDAVVRGEGEETLEELLGRLAGGESPSGVAGVTWRAERFGAASGPALRREADRPPIADLERLADPAWHLLPPLCAYKAITGEAEGLVPVDSGRGCVYDCSFCTIGRFWGRRSRPLPAARLAREMAAAAALAGARNVYLCHDLFGAHRPQALELCHLLEAQGARIPFEIRARVDHLDGELAQALGRAGCYRVLLGVESADGAVRNRHGKRMDEGEDVLGAVERLTAAGVTPILSLILGLPGSDERELAATLDLALAASLRAGVHLSFHLVNPQPGCALGESHGADSRPVDDLPPDMALGAGRTVAERALIAAHPDLFSTFAVLVGEPGGVERLRFLRRLGEELAPRLERTPRSFARLAALRGLDTLGLARHLFAAGHSFEAEARAARDGLLDDLLAWELGVLRAAARGPLGARGIGSSPKDPARPAQESGPRALAEVLRLGCDAPAYAAALARRPPGSPLAEVPTPTPGEPVVLALAAGERGVRSLRVPAALGALLEALDGRPQAELETRFGPLDGVLARLEGEGLVRRAETQARAQTRVRRSLE